MGTQRDVLWPYRDLLNKIKRERNVAYTLRVIALLLIVIPILLVIATLNISFIFLMIIGGILFRISGPILSRYRMPKNALPFGKESKGASGSGSFCYFNDNGIYVLDILYVKWDRVADVQVVDNSGNIGSIKFILKNGEMLRVSEVPYPDRLVEYFKRRFLNQGTGTLNQAPLYQSVQQVVSQPYVPSYNQPQSVSTSQPIQPVTIQGDILWPYKRRKGRINMYRRIGYALLIIGLIPLPIGIALYGLISGIILFIVFGAVFFIMGIILAVIYRIPKDALPISLPISYRYRGAVSREEAKNNYLMKNDGVYRGKKLVFKWSDVADIQLLTIDETKNEGLVKFVLRNGKAVDIPRVMYPMNLVEYVRKTYLGQGFQ